MTINDETNKRLAVISNDQSTCFFKSDFNDIIALITLTHLRSFFIHLTKNTYLLFITFDNKQFYSERFL